MSQPAEQIHQASLDLLMNPGIKIEHEEIQGLLLKAGAKKGKEADVISLPAELINEKLALCPKKVLLAGRKINDQKDSVVHCTSKPHIWSVPGMNLTRHGKSRLYTSKDLADVSRLINHLDNADAMFGFSLDDIEPHLRDVVGLNIMAQNTTKHIRVLNFTPEGADRLTEMKQVVGDTPWFSLGFTAHGPLRWTNLALEIFKRTAGHGIPASINGEPMAGVSGPVTLAGAAAVGNAEILAGIVINQILEPGRPLIYNLGLAHIFDMATAIAVTGGPENALLADISAIMGRFYHLPSASWVSTEAMVPDAQAGLEKMHGFFTHMQSGVSNIWGIGQLESELTFSTAQAVIDDEIISYVKRYQRGHQITEETLAVEVTRETGICGSFLETDHTAENFRSEFFFPKILCRNPRDTWTNKGAKSLDMIADEKADELINKEVDHGLSKEQLKDLNKIVSKFKEGRKATIAS